MLAAILIVLLVLGFVLYVSRNADTEGAKYDEANAAIATGEVMIADYADYSDPALIERDQ